MFDKLIKAYEEANKCWNQLVAAQDKCDQINDKIAQDFLKQEFRGDKEGYNKAMALYYAVTKED